METETDSDADIVIVPIIPKLDLRIITDEIEKKWKRHHRRDLTRGARRYTISTKGALDLRVAIRAVSETGNLVCALECLSLLSRFKPAMALLCGVAGNMNPDERNLGDVIVSGSCTYQIYSRYEDVGVRTSKHQLPSISPRMLSAARRIFPSTAAPVLARGTELEIGKIFCWDMILDSEKLRNHLLIEDSEYRAVEMEAAGFFKALQTFEQDTHKATGLIFRGLSHSASGAARDQQSKRNGWRAAAAKNAAQAMVHFIDNLVEDDFLDAGA